MLNTKNDIETLPRPLDGISEISFSPTTDLLAAATWDNKVFIWEANQQGNSVPKTSISLEGPALCCTWSNDGSHVFAAGSDKTIRSIDISTGQSFTIPNTHDMAIKCLKWVPAGNTQVLCSGSWDKTLKYWDLRSPQPIATVQLPERCYSMDVSKSLLAVATAERSICIINLLNPTQIYKTFPSPLKWQNRTISCFPDGSGFALGSIEGRVALNYVEEAMQQNNFAFKCHRDGNNIYPVNSISFHPTYGTFCTAGSDGYIHFWDKDSRQRLESSVHLGSPITSTCFNRNGTLFAYSLSYDWSKGHENYNQGDKNAIMIHVVQDNEVKSRGTTALRRR